MMATILNSSILNSAILDSSMLHKTLTKLVQSDSNSFILALLDDISHLEFCHHGFSYFAQKKFTHSFWLNLMMAAILNSAILDSDTAILDSDTLVSSLRFPQKHSHTILTLTQTNSIWLKLIHSHSNWWLQPSWILPSWIQPFCTKKTSLVHCDSTWWLQLCWNLPSWIQPFCTKRTSLIHSHSTWWYQPSWILPSWIQLFCTKKTSLIHSDSTWWLQLCWNLPSWIQPFAQKNFTHAFWLNLMMAAILNSAILDSDTAILDLDTLLSSLRFTQKHSSSTLTLTETNSIWLT